MENTDIHLEMRSWRKHLRECREKVREEVARREQELEE